MPAAGDRSRRGLVVVVVLAAVAGAVVFVATRSAGSAVPAAGAPHVVASEVRPLSGDVRARDLASGAASETPSAPSASGRAGHPGVRPPARPTSDEPGKKPPRPNPYASPAPPR